MDLDLLEKNLKAKISKLYLSKFPEPGVQSDVPGFDEDMGRLRSFQRRLRDHRELMSKRTKRADDFAECVKQLAYLRRIIDEGRRLLAIDVERSKLGYIQEIGLTSFHHGALESANIRVEGVPKRREGFAFGDSLVMPWDAVVRHVQAEAEKANHYVGHSIAIDFDLLRQNSLIIPKRNFTDTMWISRVVHELRDASLVKLATYFGIDASRPHNGGNDARYNMELLLAMVEAYGTHV